jgi:hypothetical protein
VLLATLIGICLFLAHPVMLRFGGLSGMVCGLMTHFGLTAARQPGGIRVLGRVVLVVLFLKIGYEIVYGKPWLVDWDGHGFIVMPLSHLVGMLTAAIWVVVQTVTSSAGMTRGRPGRA